MPRSEWSVRIHGLLGAHNGYVMQEAAAERARQLRNDAIREAIEDGCPQSEIAAALGLSRARVNQIAHGA